MEVDVRMSATNSYPYSRGDLLHEKAIYNFAPFGGSGFLASYWESRHSWVEQTNSDRTTAHDEVLRPFLTLVELIGVGGETAQPNAASQQHPLPRLDAASIDISDYLRAVFVTCRTAVSAELERTRFLKLLQRFEVTKRIWNSVDVEFRPVAGAIGDRLDLYVLFALCCISAYDRTQHLSFLNAALKTGDIICSQPPLAGTSTVGVLARLVLSAELDAVTELGRSVGAFESMFSGGSIQ